MTTDPRIAALAEALHDADGTQHYIRHEQGYDGDDIEVIECIGGPADHVEDAAAIPAILAALPPDWCGHDEDYRETPPCPFCGHREHRDDICEQDLGEHGECQCADTRPRSDADIVRAAYDRLDATNIAQAAELARLRKIEEAARADRADAARWREAEAEGHVVTFSVTGYGLRHPPSCRPDLIGCRFNEWLASRDGPTRKPGEYQMRWEGRSPTFALRAALGEDHEHG